MTPSLRSILLAVTVLISAPAAQLWAQKGNEAVKTNEMLVWPPPPAPARIKWVSELRNEFDLGAKKRRGFLDRLAGKNEDVLRLHRPVAVAVDDQGLVFVGDLGQGVVGMDPNAHKMWLFSSVGGTSLGTPSGLAVDSKLVYATDSNSNAVVIFDKQGHQLNGLGPKDGIKRPVGIAVDEGRDLVLVVNGGEHTVLLYNRALKLVKKIGDRGPGKGQFNFPTYCCFVPGVGFAVTDTGNFRVQIFDYAGKFIREFGKSGDASGNFARPKGIAVDPDGNLYVVDAVFSNFQAFRIDGQVLTFVGHGGAGKGSFQVPAGIAIAKDGAIYVADEMNTRIQKFQYLKEAAPAPGKLGSQATP